MKLLTTPAIALGLVSAMVLGSVTDAVARPHRRGSNDTEWSEGEDRKPEKQQFKRRLKQRQIRQRQIQQRQPDRWQRQRLEDRWQRQKLESRRERERHRDARVYPRRAYRYRTVRSLPRNCSRRIVQNREFYYNAYNNNYYRYSPEQDAYFVIGAGDIRNFIASFF